MNSEELEQSLRTEFESYLKNVLADMRQEVSDFQKQFEAEFEKHKTQIDEVFQNFSSRVAGERELDASFTESVVEHLRLSRDEGARITAMAIAEAEELDKQNAADEEAARPAASTVSFGEIRDGINDISTKTTQSAILKTLVNHASQFTPRGAFFIIKNEHLVGWRMFGKDGETVDEYTVREVFFPVASSTVLGEAVRSLSAVESAYGVYSDDSIYLNKLEFGQPEQMFAVPLVVRGRTVAVLYADGGVRNDEVNIDALESLVRVASMTVEILASSRGPQTHSEAAEETAEETTSNYENFKTSEREETVQPAEAETAEASVDEEEYQSVPADAYQFTQSESPTPIAEEDMPEAQSAAEESDAEETGAEESAQEDYSYAPAVEEDYSYKPIEQPVENFESNDFQTSVEGDSFSFKPSVETEMANARFVSETSDAAAQQEDQTTFEEAQSVESAPTWNQTTDDYYSKESADSDQTSDAETESSTYQISEPETFETEVSATESGYATSLNGSDKSSDYGVGADQSYESPTYEEPQYEEPKYETPQYEAESFAPSNGASYDSGAALENGKSESYEVETPVEAPVEAVAAETSVKQPSKSRYSERNVDLPIEVSEDERRLHNDARRFARLLVSEIKLYNEQKVKEGRDGNDLYDRLREAIDRSREMYDKRVQPPVAAKFDYFHYELVSNLAEGDSNKLGSTYPGSTV